MESRVGQVSDGAVCRAYLQAPGEARGAAEELLVEVVADPADRLGDQQARGGCVHEPGDAHALAAQRDRAADETARYTSPDTKAALPDRQPPPPVVGDFAPACDVVIEPRTEDPRGHAPDRDGVDEVRVTALLAP